MQHIDEGALHEYLDRGGDQDPSQHAVTAHLATCVSCRSRLEQAGSIRAQSENILRTASPVRREAPSFESIVARSAAQGAAFDAAAGSDVSGATSVTRASGSPIAPVTPVTAVTAVTPIRRRRMGVPRLAWAATMVLSLGAGWMANSLYRSGALDEREATTVQEVGTSAPSGEGGAPPAAASDAAVTSSGTTTASGSGASNTPSATRAAPEAPPVVGNRREAGVETQASRKAAESAAESPGAASGVALAADTRADQIPADQIAAVPRPVAPPSPPPAGVPAPPPAAAQQAPAQPAPAQAPAQAPAVQPVPRPLVPRDQVASRSIVTGESIERFASADETAAAMGLLSAVEWRRVSAAEATRSMRGALALAEGLPLIGIDIAAGAGGTAARVRVRQEATSGDTVAIIQYAPERERATPDNVFRRLAQDGQGATMYRLLRNSERLLVVTGRDPDTVERVAGLLRIDVAQQ